MKNCPFWFHNPKCAGSFTEKRELWPSLYKVNEKNGKSDKNSAALVSNRLSPHPSTRVFGPCTMAQLLRFSPQLHNLQSSTGFLSCPWDHCLLAGEEVLHVIVQLSSQHSSLLLSSWILPTCSTSSFLPRPTSFWLEFLAQILFTFFTRLSSRVSVVV